jgi:hypothetical protein
LVLTLPKAARRSQAGQQPSVASADQRTHERRQLGADGGICDWLAACHRSIFTVRTDQKLMQICGKTIDISDRASGLGVLARYEKRSR